MTVERVNLQPHRCQQWWGSNCKFCQWKHDCHP